MDSIYGGYIIYDPHIFGNKGGNLGNLTLEFLNLYTIATVIMMVLIAAIYIVGIYWNIRFLRIIERNKNTWIILYTIVLCSIMVIAYIYLLIRLFIDIPVDTNIFAAIVIRPMLMALGFNLIANARARYIAYKGNIALWNLRGATKNGNQFDTNDS